MLCALSVGAQAQTDTIRYVHPNGSYENDGRSWGAPKNRVQDAINDLRDYLKANNLTSGSVYIAAGQYVPTESTESSGGSMLNTSFKIYSGIHVYGGFNPANPESKPGDRIMSNGNKCSENWADPNGIGTTSGEEIVSQWDFRHKTVLSGNHSTTPPTFSFDKERGRYNTTFPASSYHVVWFGTNGKFETTDDALKDHFKPLEYPASVDGCVISSGNASTRSTSVREHTAYGGGAYLVGNATLKNCIVERCSATMRGGGIYCDGGGIVEFCFIQTCQTIGIGVLQGYGGGACVEYDGQVGHSHITNCVARCGGGLAICHVPSEYPTDRGISYYSPFSSACVINNNTATAEAGGIYLAEGGTINHATVTANNCISPDVTYYGRRHGRSGGIYIRDCGMIYNSVFWGNKCESNNDIQFASVRQVADTTGHQIFVYHTAFMNHDISDWTGVQKEMVFSLDKHNLPIKNSSSSFPCFFEPTVTPLNWDSVNTAKGIYGAGVFTSLERLTDIPGPRIWHLTSYSALDQKGVQVTDAIQDASQWIRHAHTDYGVVSNPYEPVSTLGALVRKPDPMTYALVPQQGIEGRKGNGDSIPTIFINPNRKGVYDAKDNFTYSGHEGNSWDTPVRDLGEAIQFFRQYLVDDDGGNHHYMIPALDGDGLPTGEKQRYEYIQILVKEGTINTAGPGNYLDRNIRSAAIRVESHMRLYGGYPSSLTGTNTEGRNPRDYVSTITANITGIGGVRGYENNAAHVVAMVNVEHAVVDGFTLADANTHNVYLSNSAHAGGGLLVNNASTPVAKRIHMTGNQLRNSVITNCSSPKGAAVYVNGEHLRADGNVSYAELKMVNCVIRNNMADTVRVGSTILDHGIVTANGRAYIEIEHCDIVNNVGYPFKADDKKTDDDTQQITCTNPAHSGHVLHGFIRVNNSIIFCNGDRPLDNRGELGSVGQVMSVFPDGQDYVFGEYNMFDKDLRLQNISTDQPKGFFTYGFRKTVPQEFVPGEDEGIESRETTFGASLDATLPDEKNNKAIFTRTNSTDTNYPGFVNPSRNVGVSITGDKPLYGGTVSYAPLNTNPCVNAAFVPAYDNFKYDRTDNILRNRGGAPDIGAIENTNLPEAGTVLYVTPDGAGKRDGSSWGNAIAGNTVYVLNNITGPGLAAGDSIDTQNNARLVNKSTKEPVLTTDDRYQGGFAKSWITSYKKDGISTTTSTDAWVTNIEVHDGGPEAGRDTTHLNEYINYTSTNITNSGSTPTGWTPQSMLNSNYPYGEISGASRSFWRAEGNTTPYSDDGVKDTSVGVDDTEASWIRDGIVTVTNERREKYVSGLQWAVEEAARRNHVATRLPEESFDTLVQVWVGAGKYTDYKGFIMRDSVTVLGGFPTGIFSSPGLGERKALLADSSTVTVPKAVENVNVRSRDYETILQISDINPYQDSITINPAARFFSDNDYSLIETSDTVIFEYKKKTYIDTYTYTDKTVTDITDTYIFSPTTTYNTTPTSNISSNGYQYLTYGKATATLDCWHLAYPNTQLSPDSGHYFVALENQSNTGSKPMKIYDYETNEYIETRENTTRRIGNGSLTGLRYWQKFKNIPAGKYSFTLDMMGGYRDNTKSSYPFDIYTHSNIFFHILDNDSVDLVDPIELKCRGNTLTDTNKDNVRGSAYRKTIEFTTSNDGNVIILVEVRDGTRNTLDKDATYGREGGGDPDTIPCKYEWDGGTCNKGNHYGSLNPNRREFFIANLQLQNIDEVPSYVLTGKDSVIVDTIVVEPRTNYRTTKQNYTITKTRTTLRKRVLQMPDVTNPVYFSSFGNPISGGSSDSIAHCERIDSIDNLTRRSRSGSVLWIPDPNYKRYNEIYWDGFTIRHGFVYDQATPHGGGAGVSMYEGSHLQNCIITDNFYGANKVKGGGVFCDGSTSTIEGCFILNNTTTRGTQMTESQLFAGGMFIYEGTCFNSLIANNFARGYGNVGLCVGKFYNNTVAYNRGMYGGDESGVGGIRIAKGANMELFMANCIIYGNSGLAVDATAGGSVNSAPFVNCYIQSKKAITKSEFLNAINNYKAGKTYYGIGNVFLNGEDPNETTTPFVADVDNGIYTGGAKNSNDFSLRENSGCVNAGTDDFEGTLYTAVGNYLTVNKKTVNDSTIRATDYFKAVEGVELPSNDVVFANRVQDCQIDMGAYEYDGAKNIKPDTTTHPGKAIYYVMFDSPGGDASADSPKNAACKQKLQKVLDAAGRYKHALMTDGTYDKGDSVMVEGKMIPKTFIADKPNKHWTVEVRLEGDDTNATTSSVYGDWYTPTRSTKHSIETYHDNTLDYSFIIPHGVQVKGGYTSTFYHEEGGKIVDERDPLTYRTVLSGKITSTTGAEGNCYHVVTFTDDLFNVDDEKWLKNNKGQVIRNQLAVLTDEKDRAVVDGLFIEDGLANSSDEEDKIGAGAIVPAYAHIRNCVIQNNEASGNGGGLYLLPKALVSGTIIKKNTADKGGGIYIEPATNTANDSIAHIYSTTICENSAQTTAGGLWFENTYARVNSTAIWHNTANDFANVAGSFTRTSAETDYPFLFCAVESRRLEGQGNVLLSPSETEGVRWDRLDPFNAILYYPIEMSSTLSRAGMTYSEWEKACRKYPTLETVDIAGINRLSWTVPNIERGYKWGTDTFVVKRNDFIEIGARALNKTFEIKVDEKYVMKRLFVMHTDLLDSKAARDLQDNTDNSDIAHMYRQMGSCIYNPFHRLGDAFEYIIAARKMNPAKYRNTVFEVYIEKGTYYPYRNAYGEQDEVRNNTFLVPEAIYIIGGIDSKQADHKYGQEGFLDKFTRDSIITNHREDVTIPGTESEYTINFALLDSIRLRDDRHRPMRDYNLNSVIEPWELDRQTILSGDAVSGEDFTHVYHVVTMHADTAYIGPQPIKYKKATLDTQGMYVFSDTIAPTDTASFHLENELSVLARTTDFDGIQFTGGYANQFDLADAARHPYTQKTYFCGGGILVDGNWTESVNEVGAEPLNMTYPAKYNIPIIVENCSFNNNMAANGGALFSNGGIYMFGSHFTQNYSQGPVTELDQQNILWSAGGCIAANATCDIANTLFDNNEAKRGLYPLTATSKENIPDADARQGFGGVLSIGPKAQMRVVNCHFMRNKAVAYPSIYNMLANNRYSTSDSMQFAFNTIFWGNEVFEVEKLADLQHREAPADSTENAFKLKYKGSRSGVFHYDHSKWERYEQLFQEYDGLYNYHFAKGDTFNTEVTSKLAQLRALGDSIEGLYFCSYRKDYGPSSMKPNAEGYLMTRDELKAYKDSRSTPVRPAQLYDSLFSYVHGNNNVLINRSNTAVDGPNFRQPTFVAGLDGYMQNADWLQTRITLTTDQGWGHLKQSVSRQNYFTTKYTGATQFATAEEALAAAKEENPEATEEDVFPRQGMPTATFNNSQPNPPAMYNYLAKQYGTFLSQSNPPLPLGNDYYMAYTRSVSDTSTVGNMLRISSSPRMKVEDVYIDMGIYEYQYVQLDIKGNEVDTVWVATKTKDPIRHDGLTFETPTTDLQEAIDLLMSSHNNHDKYVCLLRDDDDEGAAFTPTNVIDNRRAFVVTSNTLAPLLPDSAMTDYDYGVKSLTFLGGYNYNVKDEKRDPFAHPTVIEMPNVGNSSQRNQLFVIEDMTRERTQANYMGEVTSRDTVVIPVTFDGITFINPYSTRDANAESTDLGGLMSMKGGAAIYYRWQRQYEDKNSSGVFTPDFNNVLHADSTMLDGEKVKLPKLTISNCVFMENGARTADKSERSPAVRIDHGGGSSLIVNSLFHSNAGAPLYAKHYDEVVGENNLPTEPNDVIVVNSTFALNDGHVTLLSDHSEVHNSLIWLDDLASDTLTQLELREHADGQDPEYIEHKWNKHTDKQGLADRVTNNAFWSCFLAGDDTYRNEPLVTDNGNVFEGPRFVEPDVDASTPEERRARNFRLNPGIRTMNMADTTLYRNRVFFRMHPDTSEATHGKYWRRSNGFKSTGITTLRNDSDLASKPRLLGLGMERGAYECQAVLQRVLYVQPTLPAYSAGDGSSWATPFGQGQLQDAVDVAAVYTYLNKSADDRESRKAYVFVKTSGDSHERNDIIARDGVYVYGGIPMSCNDTAFVDRSSDQPRFTNDECQRYVNYIRSITPGVIAPGAEPSRINTLLTEAAAPYKTGFLLDGFVFTNPDSVFTTSPLVLADSLTAVRNCLFTGNIVSGSAPLADIQRGLLYNSLFYADTAQTVVRIGAHGLALNNTVIASRLTDTAIDSTEAQTGAVVNNIEGHISRLHCFAPYLTSANAYTLPAYLTNMPALAYQLHEHSKAVNSGRESLPALFDPYTADSTVHFGHDRDILGNPRRIGGNVDLGALEAWRVEPGTDVQITAVTNPLHTQSELEQATEETRRRAYLDHYGGNAYPHPGSVVYLMDSSAMTMQYQDEDFEQIDADMYFRPGYMLLKSGASFFGNGHNVRMNYVAVEKKFVNQRYSMTALPYDYSVANVIATTYTSSNDSLAQTLRPVDFRSYQYSGAARSAKDYVFQTENSSLWLPVDTLNRTATEGYLMDFGTKQDTTLRFTAFATQTNYVYTESEDEPDKTIYLTQYDHRIAGNGTTLDFTRQEDMGWNMKGLPWLVSDYRTDTILLEGNYLRQMYIPHVFYQMDGAGNYMTDGDQIYTSRSWDKGATLSMGNAFFTQTATRKGREEVIFHLPYFGRNKREARPLVRMMSSRRQSDILTAMPDSAAGKNVQYSYGRDGMKWQANMLSPQMYLLDSKRLSRISLLGAAPTEVDIPLGVYVPQNDQINDKMANDQMVNDFTFSLPEKEAFEGYRYVWLIDYALRRYTNLMEEDYTASIEPGTNNTRFAVRIGGFPKTGADGKRQYVVFATDRTLYVRGLVSGDKITVYTSSGKLVRTVTASGSEFTMPLPVISGYVVKVNDTSHKVINI